MPMKPKSFTRRIRCDERGQLVQPHTFVKRIPRLRVAEEAVLAYRVLAKFPERHAKNPAVPDGTEQHQLLADAVAAMRLILDPGPEPHKVWRGKGRNDVRHPLWEELTRLQNPEPYATTPSASAKPLTAFEGVLVACGTWLAVWRDDRKFNTGDELTRELGRAILARRKFASHGRWFNPKRQKYERTPKAPSMRLCYHLGALVRERLLPLLVWVRDEAFLHHERYATPQNRGHRRPLPTFYGSHAAQAKCAKRRAGLRTLEQLRWCSTRSSLAKKFSLPKQPQQLTPNCVKGDGSPCNEDRRHTSYRVVRTHPRRAPQRGR